MRNMKKESNVVKQKDMLPKSLVLRYGDKFLLVGELHYLFVECLNLALAISNKHDQYTHRADIFLLTLILRDIVPCE